ncbi:MAG: glycoside hydrolase family 36 N-terminal domain-containing protein, partial [Pseudomonadota bacterium]
MTEKDGYVTLTAGNTSLVLDCTIGARPSILYWGSKLSGSDPELLRLMTTRQHAPGGADAEVGSSLLNETGSGIAGLSGFSGHRNGTAWASLFRVSEVKRPAPHRVEVICDDETTKVRATHLIGFNPDSNLMTCQTQIENRGDAALSIDWCASASLPLDPRATRLFGFTGRWSGEFHLEEISPF